MVLTKDNIRVAVQVKKYQRGNLVGVKDVNQVIGGKEYYKCDKTVVVTTSDFTKATRKLAEQTGVELWNWDKLHNKMKEIYLEGKDVYEFFGDKSGSIFEKNQVTSGNKNFSFMVDKVEENVLMRDKNVATVIHIRMRNLTNEKIYITMWSPIVAIDILGNQVEAYCKYSGSFDGGYIYPQAIVPLMFCWHSDQFSKGKLIKHVIVKYREGEDEALREESISPNPSTKIIDENMGRPKAGCFIATAVYGTSLAPELDILREFRDKVLLENRLGKEFVNFYYQFSPPVANFISRRPLLKIILKKAIIWPMVRMIKFLMNH